MTNTPERLWAYSAIKEPNVGDWSTEGEEIHSSLTDIFQREEYARLDLYTALQAEKDALHEENKAMGSALDIHLWRFWSKKAREMAKKYDALKAENARLREALKPFAEAIAVYKGFSEHQLILLSEDNPTGRRLAHLFPENFSDARAALTQEGE